MYLQVVHYYDPESTGHLAAIIHALVQEATTKNCEGEACKKKRVKKFKLFIPNLLH